MALDNFRTQKIIWDKANRKIFEAIEANAGDSNGRKLVVQVINQETTESLSGTTLSLGWKSRKGAKGLDAFNLVDASKGVFEIYYTTEMLSNIGNLEASLVLIDSTSRIESSTFTISVRPSTVDDESIESENSFTALTEALVKVNDLEGKIRNAVSPKADKTYVDSQIAAIASGAPKIVTDTFGELITNYPNGSDDNALVLGDGYIYYWDGVEWKNTGIEYQSAVKKGTGEVKYIGSAPVDISYPAREITFPSYAAGVSQLIINGEAYSISPEIAKIAIPVEISNGKLLFNIVTHEFRVSTTAEELNVNEYIVMAFRLFEQNININGRYSWNGLEKSGLTDAELQSFIKGTGEVKYIGSGPVDISYPSREITFPSYNGGVSQLVINGRVYSLDADNSKTTIPSSISNGLLLFDTRTQTFRVVDNASDINPHEYIVMAFRLLEQNINFNGRYSWNGLEQSGLTDEELQSFIKGIGEVKYIGSYPVDVKYPERNVIFPSVAHLIINGKAYTVSGKEITIPENIFNGVILFNTIDETFRVVDFASYIQSHEYVVMTFRLLDKIVELNGYHSWNGISQKGVTNNDIKGVGEIKVVSNGFTDINTATREVTFPSHMGERTWLFVNGQGFELTTANSKIAFPSGDVGNVCKILFNVDTQELSAKRWTADLEINEYVVMTINALTNPFDISFDGRFTVDGELGSALEMQELRNDLSLGILAYNLEDAIYSWWNYPLAVRHIGHRDKTYLGYTDSQGYTGAASINNETGQETKKRLKKRDIDDHNASSVEILEDGRVLCVYSSGHNQDNYLTVRISSKIESIEEFDEEIKILANGTTTYAQILKKNGKFFVFFRTGNRSWSYVESSNGIDWSQPVEFLHGGMQYYCKVVDTNDADLLRIVMYSNPNETDYNMRLGFFDTTTNEFKLQDGTVVGTEGISKDAFPIILPIEEGKKQRLLDVAITDVDTTIIAYATFTDYVTARNDWQDVVYKVAYHDEISGLQSTTLTYGGKPFYYFSVYVGGMVFGYDENTLFMSRQDENDIWHIEKWETTNHLTWAMSESIHQAKEGSVAIRPTLEKDGDKLIWQEGFYSPVSFTDNNVDYKYKKVRNLM